MGQDFGVGFAGSNIVPKTQEVNGQTVPVSQTTGYIQLKTPVGGSSSPDQSANWIIQPASYYGWQDVESPVMTYTQADLEPLLRTLANQYQPDQHNGESLETFMTNNGFPTMFVYPDTMASQSVEYKPGWSNCYYAFIQGEIRDNSYTTGTLNTTAYDYSDGDYSGENTACNNALVAAQPVQQKAKQNGLYLSQNLSTLPSPNNWPVNKNSTDTKLVAGHWGTYLPVTFKTTGTTGYEGTLQITINGQTVATLQSSDSGTLTYQVPSGAQVTLTATPTEGTFHGYQDATNLAWLTDGNQLVLMWVAGNALQAVGGLPGIPAGMAPVEILAEF